MSTPVGDATASKQSPRRLLRLSVRAIMVLILVLAVTMGWLIHRARAQRLAAEAIQASGGRVIYNWGKTPAGMWDLNGQPSAPKWLVERLGVDYFGDVVLVTLGSKATDVTMEHLGRLPKLEGMSIVGKSEVTDAGAAHLRGLVELDHINLGDSKVTGPCLANFRGLSKLKSLSLNNVPVADSDLANLEGLTNLEILDLTSTLVTDAGLAHLEPLVKLKQLRLSSTRIVGPGLAHLKGMTALGRIWLANGKVADLSSFPTLPGLKWLFLDGNPVDDVQFAFLAKVPALELLSLRRTGVTDAGVATIQDLRGDLKGLALTGTKVTDASAPVLLKMDGLTTLQLDETKVTDATLDQLHGLTKLRTFDIKGSPVTEAGVARLRQAVPGIRSVPEMVKAANAKSQAAARNRPPSRPGPQP